MRDRGEIAALRTTRLPSLPTELPTTWARALRREALYAVLRPGLLAGEILPRSLSTLLYESFALSVYAMSPRLRRRTRANLERVFPRGGGDRATRRMARACFRSLGRNAVDLPRLRRISRRELLDLVEVRGQEHLDAALARGRGVIGIAPHVGNWEVLAAALAARGVPLTAVAAEVYDARLGRFVREARARWGVGTIVKGRPGSMREALGVLHRGEMLGALVDLHTRDEGVTVPFLGRESHAAAGPIRLALRTGAALVPMAIARVRSGRYRAEVLEPLEIPDTGDAARDVYEGVRRAAVTMETFIYRWPEQWLWMHDRWPAPGAER